MKETIFVLLIFFSANFLYAQKVESTYKYWMTVGFWAHTDITVNFDYNFSVNNNFYKIGYLINGISLWNGGLTSINHRVINISIGKRLQTEWFQLAFFAGPSYVFGKKQISVNNTAKFNTIGLETDLQLLFRPANEIGIGIGLYGNINFEKSFVGININITLGNGK